MSYSHLQELQHLAEIGRISASFVHEISNPITAALINLEMSDQNTPAVREAKRDMKLIHRYVEAARQQIRNESKPINFSPQQQLCQVKRILIPMAKRTGIRLEFSPTPIGCKIYGDPVKFQQIISNLVINAIQAYDKTDAYKLTSLVRVSLSVRQSMITVNVIDWGEGIDEQDLTRIFEPFYTTKAKTGYGMGVGLAFVKQSVLTEFGGSISVSSSKLHGTKFSVKLRAISC